MLVRGRHVAFVENRSSRLLDQRQYVRSLVFGRTVHRTPNVNLTLYLVKAPHRRADDPAHHKNTNDTPIGALVAAWYSSGFAIGKLLV